jgi:N-acetylneuraminate synthase
MAVAATAFGAALIEKQLTLDSKKIGMDNQMATEPEEMKLMVNCCHNTHIALGNKERVVREAEQEQMKKMRRSLIVTKDLKAGHILTEEDLDAKRPGTGIPADKLDDMVGKQLIQDVEADTLLKTEDIN